jgi:hypothetical protein
LNPTREKDDFFWNEIFRQKIPQKKVKKWLSDSLRAMFVPNDTKLLEAFFTLLRRSKLACLTKDKRTIALGEAESLPNCLDNW